MKNEKRLIDANALSIQVLDASYWDNQDEDVVWNLVQDAPTIEAVEVVHGKWILTAHEEYANYRWKVTAECSECHRDKGEVYAAFISGFPTDIARDIVLEHAESVKLDNYCPNCGAKMDGDGNG